MKVVCYPKCGTCKKALAYLENLGVGYDYRDIKLENPSYEELKLWQEKSGLEMKRFFNTSGQLYKSMELKNKLPEMSDEDMLKLLSSDGMLVKRPILVGDDFVLAGFKENDWEIKV